MSEILVVENIDSGYKDVQILWDVSLKAEEGKVTVIVGSNGSGKTTLLRTIMGSVRAKSGRIMFDGNDITKWPTYKRAEAGLIYIPEGRQLFPDMTVLENLEMGAYTKRARVKMKENLEYVFTLFPRLKERINQKAGTLSGGEQQMLAVGRGIMGCPRLMLFDEPTLGLSPKLSIEIFGIIDKLKKEKISMILVEQNVYFSLQIADYGYVLSEGRIVKEGKGEELLASEDVKKAYLGV
ncbi:MAG: ABC transporter ATP-binding protein [Thermosulfidibacteraceae bacterium]